MSEKSAAWLQNTHREAVLGVIDGVLGTSKQYVPSKADPGSGPGMGYQSQQGTPVLILAPSLTIGDTSPLETSVFPTLYNGMGFWVSSADTQTPPAISLGHLWT